MCLSGDIYDLNNEQWKIVDDSIRFYKKYSHIIADGESSFFGTKVESYIEPKGWQAVVRYCEKTGETLVIVHTFPGDFPNEITLPVQGSVIHDCICSEANRIDLSNQYLTIERKLTR